MQRARLVLVAGLTVVSCVMLAGWASAAGTRLVLTLPEGTTAKVGEPVHFFTFAPNISTSLGTVECDSAPNASYFEGIVLSNIEATDRLELRKSFGSIDGASQCRSTMPQGKFAYPSINSPGVPLGELTVTAKSKMALTFHSAILRIYFLETEETCAYALKPDKGTTHSTSSPEQPSLRFEVKASKLKKLQGSPADCPKTATLELKEMYLQSPSTPFFYEPWVGYTVG